MGWLLSTCHGDLGQDTEPLNAPDALASTLRGSSLVVAIGV